MSTDEHMLLGAFAPPVSPGVVLGDGDQSLFALTGPEMLELAELCESARKRWATFCNQPLWTETAARWRDRLRRAHREMFPEQHEDSGDDTRSADRVSSRRR